MNIVEPNVQYCEAEGLKKIELIGKVCTKQESNITRDSYIKFCKDRLKDGHTSIFEHEFVYFHVAQLSKQEKQDLKTLQPHIHFSIDGNYCGLSYRSLIDVLYEDSDMMFMRKQLCSDVQNTYCLLYAMLIYTDELLKLFKEGDILGVATLKYKTSDYHLSRIVRINKDVIFAHAIEIYLITYKLTTDRGVSHETVRHRDMSFNQESTRWCNYNKSRFGHHLNIIIPPFNNDANIDILSDEIVLIEQAYKDLTNRGETASLARSVLPNCLKTDIYVSGTVAMWKGETCSINQINNIKLDIPLKEEKGFLPQRCGKNAHPQIKELADKIAEDLRLKGFIQ